MIKEHSFVKQPLMLKIVEEIKDRKLFICNTNPWILLKATLSFIKYENFHYNGEPWRMKVRNA